MGQAAGHIAVYQFLKHFRLVAHQKDLNIRLLKYPFGLSFTAGFFVPLIFLGTSALFDKTALQIRLTIERLEISSEETLLNVIFFVLLLAFLLFI